RPRPYHRQFLYELFGKDAEAFGLLGLMPRTLSVAASRAMSAAQQAQEDVPSPVRCEDWHDAPAVVSLYGREKERGELELWLKDHSCRVIAVSGMGGAGKTALVVAAATHVKEHFECIFWRSLHTAPSVGLLLKQCLGLLTRQLPADLPEKVDDLLHLLLPYLRSQRCLVVLDNLESIMQAGQRAGCYREGYAAYGKLMRLFAETRHRSCLVLTSREKPKEVACREGTNTPVRALTLTGIDQAAGRELLNGRGLFGSKRDWAALIERYSGNPLALQLASAPLRAVFGGNIARFLQEDVSAFGEVSELLGQHFHRLSEEEREMLYWLAIEREAMPLEELRENLAQPTPTATLLELLDSLRRRSLIETRIPAHFTLQAVFREYVTGCLIERAYQEFIAETPGVWMSHALIRAKSKDYPCENQPGSLLAPLAERLLATLGKREIEQKAKNLLTIQRQQDMQHPGYLAGNILNLLDHAGCNLLSNLPL
ncbi:MAG TPA: NB-ARC domain-containing protein, partial [Ktedonobacteraceae bacterium]